ncbi:hypothetical protein Q3G72_007999 [Acer saccharum]|nr:hypothetical protein Q3G72_007999 [Acer saccharum]
MHHSSPPAADHEQAAEAATVLADSKIKTLATCKYDKRATCKYDKRVSVPVQINRYMDDFFLFFNLQTLEKVGYLKIWKQIKPTI